MDPDYVLLTRPRADSVQMQSALHNLGISALISPMIEIHPAADVTKDWLNELRAYDALLITSKHVIPYLPAPLELENIPIYAIGQETKKALELNGLPVYRTANGSSQSLKRILDSAHKKFFHPGGVHVSQTFETQILQSDLDVSHIPLYEARAQSVFTNDTLDALKNNRISHILFYSPRSAKVFANLCDTYGLSSNLSCIQALCLAASVVKSLGRYTWKDVHVAQEPQTSSMIELLKDLYNSGA